MIGKLTYEQIEELIANIINSNNNLRQVLQFYSSNEELSLRANKLLQFCNDVDRYTENLRDRVVLNKDVDKVLDRLKEE